MYGNDKEEERSSFEWKEAGNVPFFEGNHRVVCHACNKTGMLLCCDYCPLSFHPSCLQPPITERPDDLWMCPVCCDNCREWNTEAIRNRCQEAGRDAVIQE